MPSIREGVPSHPMSIPKGKSKPRHDDWAESPRDEYGSMYGSMQSDLGRTISNTSSGRRDSTSSYSSSVRRPSVTSYGDDDDDRRGSDRRYERRDSYGSPTRALDRYAVPMNRLDDRRDIDGIYGAANGHKESSYRPSESDHHESRSKKHDETGGLYGWNKGDNRKSHHRHHDTYDGGSGRHHR